MHRGASNAGVPNNHELTKTITATQSSNTTHVLLKTGHEGCISKSANGRRSTMGWSHRLAAILFLHLPLAFLVMSYAVYLGLGLLSHVKDSYIQPQMDALKFTRGREKRERTYYNRPCDEDDITASDTQELYLEANSKADDAYHLFLKHGFTAFPGVLGNEKAAALRDLIIRKNMELDPDHHFFFHGKENRSSLDLGTEAGPEVADALEEIARNELLRSSLEKMMGPNPALVELNAITSKYGCESQNWHSDGDFNSALNYARSFSPTNVLLIQLQDTTPEMGSTQVCPGTHFCGTRNEDELEDHCEEHAFQVAGEDGYWPSGDGVLMNTNSWHRGMEHTVDTGKDRVMLVLTFAPKPIKRAESRQLTHGLSHSVQWYTVGHTLKDMADAHTIMSQPWHYLRALGLYKPRNSEWGYGYITTSLQLMANGDFAYYSRDYYEMFMEKGGYSWLPSFLHGEYLEDEDEGWYEFFLDTLNRCEIFSGQVAAISLGVYVVLLFIVSWLTNKRRSDSGSEKPQSLLSTMALRLALSLGSMYVLMLLAKASIDNSSWAVDISKGRRHKPFFDKKETGAFSGPVTVPSRNDVLIETRLGSESLGMYNDFIEYHTGNQVWRRLLSENSGFAVAYKGLPEVFSDAMAWNVVRGAQWEMNSRFLYQNPSNGDWQVMSEHDAIKQTQFELFLDSNEVLRPLHTALRFLLSDCKYGFRRDTAMCTSHVPPFLEMLRDRVLRSSPSKTTTKHNNMVSPKPENVSKIHREQGIRTPQSFLTPLDVYFRGISLQQENSLTFPHYEIDTSSLFNVGEKVEVLMESDEEDEEDDWEKGEIIGVTGEGYYLVRHLETGDVEEWGTWELRRIDTSSLFNVGEEVEVLIESDNEEDRWEKGEILAITDEGFFLVQNIETGHQEDWGSWELRRPRVDNSKSRAVGVGEKIEASVKGDDKEQQNETEIVRVGSAGFRLATFAKSGDSECFGGRGFCTSKEAEFPEN